MKIVHIITRLILGGAQENTLITCCELAARGHDVTLITGPAIGPEGGLFDQTKNAQYKTIVIDTLRREINPLIDVPAYQQLKKYLKQIAPDIVHTHSAKAGILGRYAAAAIKQNQNPKPKIVHSVHGLSFHEYQNPLLNKLYITIEKVAAKKTDAFICVADEMTKKSLAVGIGQPAQYTTAYSAIDVNAFSNPLPKEQIKNFRQKYNIPSDVIVIATIARLFHLKGHEYIIESAKTLAKKYPKTIWLFVGDGLLKQKLKNQITIAGLQNNFRFTGLLPTTEMPLVLQSSDMLVHCSLREGLARVLPQALAVGIPAISFDIDGAKEVINNATGRLTQAKNIEQLIAACSELMEDKNLRNQLGKTGEQNIKQKFAPKIMVDTIEKVYKNL